jgi:hypothetical protein
VNQQVAIKIRIFGHCEVILTSTIDPIRKR